jgi:hypothetical protein
MSRRLGVEDDALDVDAALDALDMTELRFVSPGTRKWAPLASQSRAARRRVKVCAAIRLDLGAPSTVRHWDDNGVHP